jgi:uncharacterized repeat protein (TIGR01451 family)
VLLSNDTLSGNAAVGGAGGAGGIAGQAGFPGSVNGPGGAAAGAGFGLGGGIVLLGGQVQLTNDTFSGNLAQGGNGATAFSPSNGNDGEGGALAVDVGSALLVNDTFSGNAAVGGVGGQFRTELGSILSGSAGIGQGGGLFVVGGTVSLINDLVAQNSATFAPDVDGSIALSDHNLIGNTFGSTGFSQATGDLLNIEPNLAPLGNYGGPTQTMPLLPGSPGIDAGDNIVLGPKHIPGLAHWYQANGNANDSAGTSNGTIFGGVSFAPGVAGQAFSFNGQNSYVDLGTAADVVGTGAFSVAAWIKTTSDGVILQQRDAGASNGEYQLAVSGGKVYWWSFSNGQYGFNFTSNASVNDGSWHYVVATRLADGTGQIWIDGMLDSSQAAAPASLGSGIHVYIGEDVRDATLIGVPRSFIGQIAETQIYTTALTPVQISALYATSSVGLSRDQRGDPRGVGPHVDIGATEYQYDLAIKGSAASTVTAGNQITYTLTIVNNGPDPVSSAVLNDVLPSTVSFVSFTVPSGWAVSEPAVGHGGIVTATDNASLLAGQSASFTLVLQALPTTKAGTKITNQVSVLPRTDDTKPANNNVTFNTTVVAGTPAGVDIHGQPGNSLADAPIHPAVLVAVVDAYGNTVTGSDQLVTLAIATGPAGATLGGTTTVRAVHGVAIFRDLTLNVAGTYTLTATGGTLTPDFSNPFTISPQNVTDDVTIHPGALRPEGARHFDQTLTLTNPTDHAMTGPLALVFEGLPTDRTLLNSTGSYHGAPSIDLLDDGVKLAAEGSVTITLEWLVAPPHGRNRHGTDFHVEALLGI